jgi:hypothetical protein
MRRNRVCSSICFLTKEPNAASPHGERERVRGERPVFARRGGFMGGGHSFGCSFVQCQLFLGGLRDRSKSPREIET